MKQEANKIRMVLDHRRVPEGGCPVPFELPEWGDQRQVLVGGGDREEVTHLFPPRMELKELLSQCGADAAHLKAVCLGWPAGRILPVNDLSIQVELNCETLYLVNKAECMLDVLARLSEELRSCACGRCVFGREGTYQLHLMLSDMVSKKGRSTDLDQMEELCAVMLTQTACSMGQAAASAMLDALKVFRSELEAHIVQKTCPAAVCRGYVSYYIDPMLCTGCQECVDACEEEAIEGRKGMIHILDRSSCEKCGECVGACPAGAIRATGGTIPRGPVRPIPCGTWK